MITPAATLLTNQTPGRQWVFVTRRFQELQKRLRVRQSAIDDDSTKLAGVVKSLNRTYWGESTTKNYFLGGSWGKGTVIQPPTDIDVFFLPPVDIYHQFNARQGNKQSQLLQSMRSALGATYPQTRVRGDGQVVVVGFNSIEIEIVPAFLAQGGGYLTCDTNGGGSWKVVNPASELAELNRLDKLHNGNVRKLSRIIKQWKRHCNVPIKSFHIEVLVAETLAQFDYGKNGEFWFDWLVRDIFAHMHGRAGGHFFMPGNGLELISLGDAWQTKAQSAYQRAANACDYERENREISAGMEWQKIFGPMIPEIVD